MGETENHGAADVFVDDRKLVWVRADARHKGIHGVAEALPQTRGFTFIPILFLISIRGEQLR